MITQQGIIGIKYWDAANVVSLFIIIGLGSGAQFTAFEIFRKIRGLSNAKRLAITAQRSLLMIGTPFLVTAGTYLAMLSSGVRVMGFIGVFFALLLFFMFFFLYTWTIPVFALWAKWFEPADPRFDRDDARSFRSPSLLSLQSRSRSDSRSHDGTSEDADAEESEVPCQSVEYPYTELFGFAQKRPIFNVDGGGGDTSTHNFIQTAFYRYLTSLTYFYRLPIVLVVVAVAAALGSRAFCFGTKTGFQFLDSYHPVQRGFALFLDGFANPAVDQEFVYIWGVDPKPRVCASDRLTIDSYGSPTYRPINVTDPDFQMLINGVYAHLLNQSLIDCPDGTNQFGTNPWSTWSLLFGIASSWLVQLVTAELSIEPLPVNFPITVPEYATWGWLYQLLAGKLSYEEPENFFRGMAKANCIGFSRFDYHLQYIGVKTPFRIPPDHVLNHAVYRRWYDMAVALDQEIKANASDLGLDIDGWFTGASYLDMVTEEKLPRQVIVGSAIGLGIAAGVLILTTFSIRYSIVMTIAIVAEDLIVLGIFGLVGWKIGCNEAVMFTVIVGLASQVLIVPTIGIIHDRGGRSAFGKLQNSVATFSAPVLYTLCTTLWGCAFMFPCDIILLPPFAILQLTAVAFAALLGLFGVPAALAIVARGEAQSQEPLPGSTEVLDK
jgi:hypothetical protein